MDNTLKAPQPRQIRVPNGVAGVPFDDKDADLILRSCDGTDFHVFRGILILYSPIFRDMLSLPSPPRMNYHEGGKPVVDVQENSTTLDSLLRFCYPTADNPKIATKDQFCDVISAAMKFEMTSLYNNIIDSHLDEALLRTSPLEYYDLAHKLRLRCLAQKSARGCLYFSLEQVLEQSRSTDCSNMSVKDFTRLLHYVQICSDTCRKLISPPKESLKPEWVPTNTSNDGARHDCGVNHCWFECLNIIHLRLKVTGLRMLDVNIGDFEIFMGNCCSKCRTKNINFLASFLLDFQKQINLEIDRVDLVLDF